MKLLINGYGVSGRAVANYCDCHRISYHIVVNEEEEQKRLHRNGISALLSRDMQDSTLNDYSHVIRSPGIPYYDSFLDRIRNLHIPIWSELEFAYGLQPNAKYLVISGSNGKTTTVEFIKQLLEESYPNVIACGNLGIPLITYIDEIVPNQIVVIEASNFQLESSPNIKPFLYGITNLSPNHLDKVPSLEWYYRSKCELANRMNPDQIFIQNADDEELTKRIQTKATKWSFSQSTNRGDCTLKEDIVFYRGEPLVPLSSNRLFSYPHNVDNLMLSVISCLQLGVTLPQLRNRIPRLHGVRYRMEPYINATGKRIYHDGKSSTPSSTAAALKSLTNHNVHLIIGGYNKQLSFADLSHLDYKKMYAYGACRDEIALQCPRVTSYLTMQEAFLSAQKESQNEDVILYSPGCASFDQYPNYLARCQEFERLVKSYGYEQVI